MHTVFKCSASWVATIFAAAAAAPASAAAAPEPALQPTLWTVEEAPESSGTSDAPLQLSVDESAARQQRRTGARLILPLPGEDSIEVFFVRSEDHGHSVWTWIGETTEGERATLSFGPGAVFGRVERAAGAALQITTEAGRAWLRTRPPAGLIDRARLFGPADSDVSIPPRDSGVRSMSAMGKAAPKGGPVNVDVVVGMSSGFVAAQGGLSVAQTKLAQLVALANDGLERGLVEHRLRLVHSLQVNYTDLNANLTALEAVTGVSCNPACTPQAVPIGLQPLRAARDTYGGDLVVLLRRYRDPEQQGCGQAWLLGAGGFEIDNTDAPFGYAVASIGSDLNESSGFTTFCRDSTLAHELGHTMGQAHNIGDASGSGTHSYAYGYREASSTGFYTIMAYRLANSSQFGIDYFANPAVTYASTGRPTGTANANTGRSLQLSMPLVAQFRAESPAGLALFENGFETQ
jgi:hypothetical protein